MTNIECIFCKTQSNTVVIEENGFIGKKCEHCGLIYISPRPSFDDILNIYGHDDAQVSANAHIGDEFTKRLYAKHHLQILRSHIQNGKILEIGAGAGYFLDEAKKIGFDPYAIEFNPIQSKFIRDELKIPCEECPVSTKIFNGTKFDVVYHCDVTSHFYDPIDTFKEINAVTKPGGILFFETGNLGEVSIEKLHTIEKFQYPDHLFFYSVNNISTLLNMCGFEIVGINRYSIVPQLAYIRYSNSIKKTLKRYFGKRAIPRNDNSETTQATPIRSKGLFNKIDEFVSYYIRYSIGKVLNKKDRPQTVLIVARKK